MNKPLIAVLLMATAFVSCRTINVEQSVRSSRGVERQAGFEPDERAVAAEPEIAFIEQPIYIPQGQAAQPPPRGAEAVRAATARGVVQPQDYSHAAMIYDYHRDFVYELYCRPLRVSDITLRPGERTVEPPFISDSERWMLGAGVSYESGTVVQHIYVKPTAANLEATLIINTNERVYHLILRSFASVHMPIVRWRYREAAMPQRYIGPSGQVVVNGEGEQDDASLMADPRFLSFNYRITYGLFKKPRWLPTLAYDDGKKTYVAFPETVLQTEFPAVFKNRADVVNYRVARNVMIIDELIERITVRLGDRSVTIEKKRGK